jgi:CDP-diacylglycerol--serine O-phosphatidyltransferase
MKQKRDIFKKRELGKITVLPNIITTAGMFFGFLSITSSLNGNMHRAGIYIFLAIIFDSLDGRIARMTKTVSSFGGEYDSLSDLLSFGIAPAVFLYLFFFKSLGKWGVVLPFIYAVCTAMRLARFNIQSSSVEKKNFMGLPSPGAAGCVVSTALIFQKIRNYPHEWEIAFFGILTFLNSMLMISQLRFRAFKEIELFSRVNIKEFLLFVMGLLLFVLEPIIFSFCAITIYIIWNLIENLYISLRKKKLQEVQQENAREDLHI